MMGATLKDKDGNNRFTNSAGINVENALNEYQSDRDVILKSKTPILLDIKGMSSGIPNVINTVNGQKVLSPIKGRVIGSKM